MAEKIKKSLKELSREGLTVEYNKDDNGFVDVEIKYLIAGSLSRIADSNEIMAKNNQKLIANLEMYKRWYRNEQEENQRLRNKIKAHKSAYTRLKNKMAKNN